MKTTFTKIVIIMLKFFFGLVSLKQCYMYTIYWNVYGFERD